MSLKLKGGPEDEEMLAEDQEPSPAQKIGKIFIIDHHFALDQIDILENCDILSNLVIPDTVLRHLNRKNVQAFHGLRNTLE